MKRQAVLYLSLIAVLGNLGCSGGRVTPVSAAASPTPLPPPQPVVTITILANGVEVPAPGTQISIPQGFTLAFTAAVSGTTNTGVIWSVQEAGGGSITSSGVYTAPFSAGSFHVVATSVADSSRKAIAGIDVQQVSVSMSPSLTTLLVNSKTGFDVVVRGTVRKFPWSWSVQESGVGGTVLPDPGNTAHASYTAPPTPGTFHIVAVNQDDGSQSVNATVTVAQQLSARTFAGTGSMTTPRGGHTATLLADGRVLIAGGDDRAFNVSTAEIYDPDSGLFQPTASMTAHRYGHTSVLLRDGRVFIAGGIECIGSPRCTVNLLRSAEIYDPTTQTFTAVGNMLAAHPCPNATLLSNGKVLILGAGSGSLFRGGPTAEIYDPETGAFSAAGDGEAFSCPTAVPLANGKILLGPSWNYDETSPSSLEIYDPATGQYQLSSPVQATEAALVGIGGGTTLTLLKGGSVLIAGGQLDDTYCTYNGCPPNDASTTAWRFDPLTASVQKTGSMVFVRFLQFTHTLLPDGTVLMTGGYGSGFFSDNSAEVYDPSAGAFVPVGKMSTGRSSHTATLLNDGRVLIAGGDSLASAELYYPSSNISQASIAAQSGSRK